MKPETNDTKSSEILSCTPEVTVIVVTYNQDLNRILRTLNSIVIQEEISIEIIICDDGSEIRFENELKSYFSSKNFCRYTLIFHDANRGTVSNYYSGLSRAKGRYTKLISPGDYFTDKKILNRWVRFLQEKNAEWSFSDAYYYRNNEGKIEFIREKARPQIIEPYKKGKAAECIWNYVVLQDIANGASIIGTTDVHLRYCRIIREEGVKYAEDHIYRLLMLHGIVGCYFPAVTIYYEYGTGVSTSFDPKWGGKLAEDKIKLIQILNDYAVTDPQKRMADAMRKSRNKSKLKKLFIRGKLYLWLKRHYFPRLTPIPDEADQYESL